MHLVTLDSAGARGPYYLRLANALMRDIQRRRLMRGEKLPATRSLATQLCVHRNTVVRAYRELALQGFVATHTTRGTFVSWTPSVEFSAQARSMQKRAPVFHFHRFTLDARGVGSALPLSFGSGYPDLSLFPSAALAAALRRVLCRRRSLGLGYHHPQGYAPLRTQLAQMLSSERVVMVDAEQILVTQGSQMGLDLIARTLAAAMPKKSRRVAVEALGYRPAWQAFERAGLSLSYVAIDHDGLSIEHLEKILERQSLHALYITPHHQYPTTRTLSLERRTQLLHLARKHRFLIIEDDYDHEFHYEGRPIAPLASHDAFDVLVYVSSLSKVFAPGFRLGYVAGHSDFIASLTALRATSDGQGNHALEAALTELFEDGEIARHARRMRRVYLRRRDALCEALESELKQVTCIDVPSGGMGLWVAVEPAIALEVWRARARRVGVDFPIASEFSHDDAHRSFIRLGFTRLDENQLRSAVKHMRHALSAQ